ncbi:hypothetical protein ScPMuIL_010070 [Solemya velum]
MTHKLSLSERPKPPSGEAVLADIDGCTDDDVVFRLPAPRHIGENDNGDMSMLSVEDSIVISPSTDLEKEEMDSEDRSETEVDNVYSKATKLIELHETLQKAPKQIENDFTKLEKLGAEVSESIVDLRKSAEAVFRKS